MLETERLILRPMNETTSKRFIKCAATTKLCALSANRVSDRREAENWINLISSRWAKDKIGFCALIEKRSGKFAGWCGLWQLKESGEIEVGYAVAREFWGKGYASESAEAFLNYGFNKLNLEKIVAVARQENTASRRVMEKIGMKFDGIGKYYDRDLVHYSIKQKRLFNAKTRRREMQNF